MSRPRPAGRRVLRRQPDPGWAVLRPRLTWRWSAPRPLPDPAGS